MQRPRQLRLILHDLFQLRGVRAIDRERPEFFRLPVVAVDTEIQRNAGAFPSIFRTARLPGPVTPEYQSVKLMLFSFIC